MHARYYTGWIKVPNLIPKNKRKRTKNKCFIVFKGIFTHFDAPTLCDTQFASSFNVNGKLEDRFFVRLRTRVRTYVYPPTVTPNLCCTPLHFPDESCL